LALPTNKHYSADSPTVKFSPEKETRKNYKNKKKQLEKRWVESGVLSYQEKFTVLPVTWLILTIDD
jgi:hypothetical protein